MHVVALVRGPNHASCRYRLGAFQPLLEQAGHSLQLQTLPTRWWSRWWLYRQLQNANVILQRRLLPAWELAILRRRARRLIFDFDDAVFHRDSYAVKGPHDPARMRRFQATLRLCDAVTAGNRFLAQNAEQAGGRNIHLIPTCVDPLRYTPRRPDAPGDGRTLVWIGSSSTLQGLEAIAPLLEELGKNIPGLRLKVICDRFPRFEHLEVVPCPWQADTEARELASGEIGISWVPDDPWSRGKCGLKVLQYMAAGLPVVANPVGVHEEMIRPGQTGYLASTPAQWCEAVGRLSRDAELRRQLGSAGRAGLEKDYSIARGAAAWIDLLGRLETSRQAG